MDETQDLIRKGEIVRRFHQKSRKNGTYAVQIRWRRGKTSAYQSSAQDPLKFIRIFQSGNIFPEGDGGEARRKQFKGVCLEEIRRVQHGLG